MAAEYLTIASAPALPQSYIYLRGSFFRLSIEHSIYLTITLTYTSPTPAIRPTLTADHPTYGTLLASLDIGSHHDGILRLHDRGTLLTR
jgi:hypothetical protein